MRGISRAELIRFLFDRLGLRGPLWEAANAPTAAAALGMFQIDSIRVTGLRNHDLAWIARSDAPLATIFASRCTTASDAANRSSAGGRWRSGCCRKSRAVTVADLPDNPVYWYPPEDETAWDRVHQTDDGAVRIVPPLDNLMFSRKRFSQLFGFDYKFEAYTPREQRRIYFAMPVLHAGDVVGLLDARLDRSNGRPEWQIVGLDMMKPAPPAALRAGIHRLARGAGAAKVAVATHTSRDLRRALSGRCDN